MTGFRATVFRMRFSGMTVCSVHIYAVRFHQDTYLS